ncbi:NAD-dependent succinate-semialdehyde dehydrogenase [Pedobacter sp.]|uniref:NAD-dependent succinate-semialdehyde dehydrogenase n=1 Tax=Pedobacter sp. TaxID=1411316 RepID=UPI003D7F1A9A
MSMQSINPVNGEVIKTYKKDTPATINKKIEQAQAAFVLWRNSIFKERAVLLKNAAAVLRKRQPALAELMALEMGKPLKQGMDEIEKCAKVCEYYAENGEKFLKDDQIATEATRSYVSFQPLGVILAIMPWNFPFWQAFRFLAPGLMAGNCALLKHASNVTGCALAIEDILLEAGLQDYAFQTLVTDSASIKNIIENPVIKAVTLTGSTNAGMEVAKQAAGLLKKAVLELGGSDPYIVLEDADLEYAAGVCAESRLLNNGQSCIAAKRFILVESIADQFLEIFVKKMSAKKTGDPFEKTSDLGPMARKDLRDELHQQVIDNINAGAQCILGGEIPEFEGDHAYYTPTILTGITKGMPAYSEEIFGPVALVFTAKNGEEAVKIANDSPFGLGTAVFTRNEVRGELIARNHFQSGSCFVNSMVKSDPRLPFGGIKQSGYGRELGIFGIREFVNIKTVYVR